jgi:hypothetical protein
VVPAYNYGQTFLALIFVMYPLKEKNDSKYWYGGGCSTGAAPTRV